MTRAVVSALIAHWRRQPLQLATLVIGLALATALWSGVQAINAEARASYDDAAGIVGGGATEVLESAGPIDAADFVRLRRAGWLVSPVVEGWIGEGADRVRLTGIDPLTAPEGSGAATVFGALRTGETLQGDLIFAAPGVADGLGAALAGDGVEVRAVDGLPDGVALSDVPVAQRLLGLEGRLTRLILLDGQPLVRPPLDEVAPGLDRRPPETGADLARLTDSFHLNLTAFGLLSFAVGLFIVNGAIGLAFEQRRGAIRTLRALGVPAGRLIACLGVELLLFALVAGGIGLLLGYLIAAALLPDVAATLRGLYGATVSGGLTFRPGWAAAGLGIALLGTAVAGGATLVKASRLPLLAPARPRAWARASADRLWLSLGAAALCAVVAVLAVRLGGGLVAGFVLLGGLLLAAALVLPGLLAGALTLGGRTARGPRAEWFWADTLQQLPGLSLALMALLLALAANIGVGTMVSSFRLTFTGYLDQRLAADVYVSFEDAGAAARAAEALGAEGWGLLPIWRATDRVFGREAEVVSTGDHPVVRRNWPILDGGPDLWDRVAAGDAVLVNEQLARAEGLAPGDRLSLTGWQAEIAGVYGDYGNPRPQVLAAPDTVAARYPDARRTDFGLVLPDGQDADGGRARLAELGAGADRVTDQRALKDLSLSIFERTFAVTGALNVLTLGVAGFAILTSLLTLASMRLPQLAPLWALGETRRGLARLELARALLLAALTFVAAVPVGLLLAWALLSVVNVAAFGWKIPLTLFPLDWLRLGALSAVAAGLAALWPARRLARTPPSDLVKVFAHER